MDSMPISKFKATCLETLERVRRTGRPLRVTRFGKAVADIVPPGADERRGNWLGAMRETGKIVGDVTATSPRDAALTTTMASTSNDDSRGTRARRAIFASTNPARSASARSTGSTRMPRSSISRAAGPR